ncbi:hypothetical protein SBA5_1580003 [Candidatus Sulfotelmatomonas gaucii]|uniref:Uncharacterized protein n=1 Tax=Candidatus Sulfuritelmatomonas gaucii TaxID=2043161 RepID=A0A2N9L5D0_9BACT|nr:hypothetical protein SBA5_1580003 [Candidatus Sulfotelmatomonas gaucii]
MLIALVKMSHRDRNEALVPSANPGRAQVLYHVVTIGQTAAVFALMMMLRVENKRAAVWMSSAEDSNELQPYAPAAFPHERSEYKVAPELETRMAAQNATERRRGSMLQWANKAHQLARTEAYFYLSSGSPGQGVSRHAREVKAVVEVHKERTGARWACLVVAVLT